MIIYDISKLMPDNHESNNHKPDNREYPANFVKINQRATHK